MKDPSISLISTNKLAVESIIPIESWFVIRQITGLVILTKEIKTVESVIKEMMKSRLLQIIMCKLFLLKLLLISQPLKAVYTWISLSLTCHWETSLFLFNGGYDWQPVLVFRKKTVTRKQVCTSVNTFLLTGYQSSWILKLSCLWAVIVNPPYSVVIIIPSGMNVYLCMLGIILMIYFSIINMGLSKVFIF